MPIELIQELQNIKFNQSNFNETIVNNTLENKYNSGQTLVKQNWIDSPNIITGILELNYSELIVFKRFFEEDLKSGALSFYWRHPVTGSRIECRIISGFQVTTVGYTDYDVSLILEIINDNA